MMHDPAAVLEEARRAPARTELGPYLESVRTLRGKKWSWREIADFLKERGVDTDHTKLIRFVQKHEKRWQVPSADAYYEALKQLRKGGKVGAGKWAMLRHLYLAHNRTSTYTLLAEAAARSGAKVPSERPHNYANLEFGKLGKLLGQTLGMEFLPSSNREEPFYSSSLGVGSSTTPEGGEFELVMHHELAKALDRLVVEDKELFKQTDGGCHV
jgi:hypothetical protein